MKKATAIVKATKTAAKNAVKKVAAKNVKKVAAKKVVVKKEVAAKPVAKKANVVKMSAYESAVAMFKEPSAAAARKLLIGDVIEVFYADAKEPSIEVVVKCAETGEDIFDVATVMQEKWGTRSMSMTKVNSSMWRKIGTMQFKVSKA